MSFKSGDGFGLSKLSKKNYNIYDCNFTDYGFTTNFVNRMHPSSIHQSLETKDRKLNNYDSTNCSTFYRKGYSVTARQAPKFFAKGENVFNSISDLDINKNIDYNSEYLPMYSDRLQIHSDRISDDDLKKVTLPAITYKNKQNYNTLPDNTSSGDHTSKKNLFKAAYQNQQVNYNKRQMHLPLKSLIILNTHKNTIA